MPFTVAFVANAEAKEVLRKLNYYRERLKQYQQEESFAYIDVDKAKAAKPSEKNLIFFGAFRIQKWKKEGKVL